MNRLLFLAVIGVLMAISQAAQGDDFEARQYKGADGNVLPYRLLKPAHYDASQKYPLVVFLHGAGERGADNQKQVGYARKFLEQACKDYPCFAMLPQCPENRRWVEVDWSAYQHAMPAEPSVPMGEMMAALEQLRKEFNIDSDRIYVMGLSMGGYGTWDALARYPKVFAAGVPICGGADLNNAKVYARKPIWAFHGDADPTVPVQRSRFIVETVKAAGGTPRYTEYPGMGHASWVPAMREAELAPWLFAQRLGQPMTQPAK